MWEAMELGLNGTVSSEWCAVIVFLPVALYIIICIKGSSASQLRWAVVLSVLYAIIMILLLVSIAIGAGRCPINMTLLFLLFLIGLHVLGKFENYDVIRNHIYHRKILLLFTVLASSFIVSGHTAKQI